MKFALATILLAGASPQATALCKATVDYRSLDLIYESMSHKNNEQILSTAFNRIGFNYIELDFGDKYYFKGEAYSLDVSIDYCVDKDGKQVRGSYESNMQQRRHLRGVGLEVPDFVERSKQKEGMERSHLRRKLRQSSLTAGAVRNKHFSSVTNYLSRKLEGTAAPTCENDQACYDFCNANMDGIVCETSVQCGAAAICEMIATPIPDPEIPGTAAPTCENDQACYDFCNANMVGIACETSVQCGAAAICEFIAAPTPDPSFPAQPDCTTDAECVAFCNDQLLPFLPAGFLCEAMVGCAPNGKCDTLDTESGDNESDKLLCATTSECVAACEEKYEADIQTYYGVTCKEGIICAVQEGSTGNKFCNVDPKFYPIDNPDTTPEPDLPPIDLSKVPLYCLNFESVDKCWNSQQKLNLGESCDNCRAYFDQLIHDPAFFSFPNNYMNPHSAGTRIFAPHYAKDSISAYFASGYNSNSNYQEFSTPWDNFSPFTDIDVQYDALDDRCIPIVKLTSSEDEDMEELISVDGVSTKCLVDFMSGISFTKEYKNEGNFNPYFDERKRDHPIDALVYLRNTMRRATGAAPPTELDGEDQYITVVKRNLKTGVETTSEVQLTYKKFVNIKSIAKRRRQMYNDDKCSNFPNIKKSNGEVLFDANEFFLKRPIEQGGPDTYSADRPRVQLILPDSCSRFNSMGLPRTYHEMNYKPIEPPDWTKMSYLHVSQVDDAVSGSSQKNNFFDRIGTMQYCYIRTSNIVDKNGKNICGEKTIKAEIPEPMCNFVEAKKITDKMTDVLRKIREGKVEANAQLFLPLFGSTAWGNCASLIGSALTFTNVDRTVSSMACVEKYGQARWKSDPCCNWELQQKMCCAPRDVTFPVPEPTVDTSTIAAYCSDSLEQLAMAIYASKTYVETLRESVDSTKGCLGQQLKESKVIDTLYSVGDTCLDVVMGVDRYDGQKKISSLECTTNQDCFTGECAAAVGDVKTRFCATSQSPEHLIACIYDKLEVVPKAKAIFKDMVTGGKVDPSDAQVADSFAYRAGRENCLGQNGWNFNPNWRNCENWNSEKGICDKFYCDNRADCKEKCLDSPSSCNARPWDPSITDASACLATGSTMGDKLCARCWGSSSSDCQEVSQPSKCEFMDWSFSGEVTDAVCASVGTNMVSMFSNVYGGRTICSKTGEYDYDECVGGSNACEDAGFHDVYQCVKETVNPNDYMSCYNLEGGSYTPHWYMVGNMQVIGCLNKDIPSGKTVESIAAACEAAGSTPLLISTAKNSCINAHDSFCYNTAANAITESECISYDLTGTAFDAYKNSEGLYIFWEVGSQKCRITRSSNTNDWSVYTSFKEACNALPSWKYFTPMRYEEGKFDTEEKCGAGVCDMGGEWQSEEECTLKEECDRWSCNGCQRDWSKQSTSVHSICVFPEATAETCTGKASSALWDVANSICVINKESGKDQCTDVGLVWSSCDSVSYDTCSSKVDNGSIDFKLSSAFLKCVPTRNAKCNTKEECENGGECHGGLQSYGCTFATDGTQDCSYRSNVCVVPKTEMQGYKRCDVYGNHQSASHLTGPDCALVQVKTEADCAKFDYCPFAVDQYGNLIYDAKSGEMQRVTGAACKQIKGEWQSTIYTKDRCLELEMCKQNAWSNNDFNEHECDKCEQDWGSVRNWYGGTWRTGKMRPMYKWMDRKWGPGREWVKEIDRWMVSPLLRDVVDKLSDEVESTFVQCMYGGLIDSVNKVSCACGIDRTTCDAAAIFGSLVSLVNTTSYKDAAEMAGRELATRIDIADDTLNSTTTVEIGQMTFIPKASSSAGDNSLNEERRDRRLSSGTTPSINDAECSTVVTNSGGSLIGQLVGDCVTLKVSSPLTNPARLCVATKDAIIRAPVFDTADIAVFTKGSTDEDDVYTAQDIFVRQIGSQFCFNVTDSIIACPIMRVADFQSQTEDVASGECALLDLVMNEIVMQKQCTAGDRKSCKWLEPGSTSFFAAIGLILVIIGAVIATCCLGACAHPKSRAVMTKHINAAFFKSMDTDGDGLMSKEETRKMFEKEFGKKFSIKEIDALYARYDVNADGQLSYDEYKNIMNSFKKSGGIMIDVEMKANPTPVTYDKMQQNSVMPTNKPDPSKWA